MNKTHLETFRGLINQFDLDLNYNMKLSSLDKVLEDSMSFLSSLYEKKINININTGSLLHHSKIEVESFSTIYVVSDLSQNEDNDLIIIKSLYLSKDINFEKDQLIISKQYVVKKINLNDMTFMTTNTQKGIYSAYKGIVKKEDCDQMAHMNVQFYFGKHSDAIKNLFNEISSNLKQKVCFEIENERCIFSKEVHLNCSLEIVLNLKSISKNKLILLNKVFCIDNKNVSAYFEMTISLNISEKIKEVINKIFTSNNTTYLNELEFKNLRLLEGNRPTKKIDNTAFMTCKKAVNTWDLDYSQMGSSQFKVGCVSDAATHLFTYCGADYNWRSKYNIGSAALDYSVRYYKTAPLGMAVTMYSNFTKIGNKSLKFIHHMIDDTSGEVVMDIEIVAVLFDLEKRKSMEVPHDFRKKGERILLTN